MERIIWQPANIENTNIMRFSRIVAARWNVRVDDFDSLHRFSIKQPDEFWASFWDFAAIKGNRAGPVMADDEFMARRRFFPQSTLNFAENLLQGSGSQTALWFFGEDRVKSELSKDEVRDAVKSLMGYFGQCGIGAGDRVAGVVANMPQAIIAMLACTGLGAVWTSCSPDFGVQGIVDRFGQTTPKILIGVDQYAYNGKLHDCREKLGAIANEIPSITHTIVISYLDQGLGALGNSVCWNDALCAAPAVHEFAQFTFDHPAFVMYSSGTTGKPKCIIHSGGGVLLKVLAEHYLHGDMNRDETLFYFTTCGWMMWNWLVAGMATGAALVLYDGAPTYPEVDSLFRLVEDTGITSFGTSAKYIDVLRHANATPATKFDLSSMRLINSTGSPLVAESFDYIHQHIKSDVAIASMSGGTDILGCFVGGVPTKSLHRGAIQGPILGMDVKVYNDRGVPVSGEKGELVCCSPFPSMPLGFYNDDDGSKYFDAYFAKFAGVWNQGDFAEMTAQGGFILYGRSDATLNPGGVRIGTAEIYRQVEGMVEIAEAVCVGQSWQDDVRVVLFVVMAQGCRLDDDLRQKICMHLRTRCSPRHVPAKILAVDDIPRTRSGKITEIAVREIIHGRAVKNVGALANPQSLDQYRDLPALQDA